MVVIVFGVLVILFTIAIPMAFFLQTRDKKEYKEPVVYYEEEVKVREVILPPPEEEPVLIKRKPVFTTVNKQYKRIGWK